MPATTHRSHDALWHAHQALVLNDRELASVRRFGKKATVDARRLTPSMADSDPGDAAAAVRAACQIASRAGMDAAELREVLEALGLAQATPAKGVAR
ncbi:hypothetical protein Ssi03_50950 [Sphaerisporangium siamense]|uniref:Uncharacterized protein n=1 Tax=Sphaerisporangium siamense TaxID=795645 RepID=A0A7W7DAU8_9ACTN|nr:hypothetical protein [Sphaerisporangium siamense]MBB4702201.1 hypothetical protein [Sphaerisporangium siamense]GII87105.1 hypothetical protein Ssi03_50950 [Sphaerisporangium siamense]